MTPTTNNVEPTTSATDELRALLDERGAEYRVSATGYSIDIGPYITAYANRSDTTLDVSLRNVTPEQAVEATLGRGTCQMEFLEAAQFSDEDMRHYFEVGVYRCSECGTETYGRWTEGEELERPDFCPNCGRKVAG